MGERCYVSVDIEGSFGKDAKPPVLSVISIGACVIGEPEKRFYRELKPISDHWDPEAEKIHKLSREYLDKYGVEPFIAMWNFSDWVVQAAAGRPAVFCATPISYDWNNVKWYLDNFKVSDPFEGTLDGRNLYRRIKGLSSKTDVPRAKVWEEFPTSLPHTHNALDDALEQEEVFRQMLQKAKLL